MPGKEFFPGQGRPNSADEGMANVLHLDPTGAEESLLEGKDAEQFADVASQEADAARPPGPELGGDEVHHRNTVLVQEGGEAEVDAGQIDKNGEARAAAEDFGAKVFLDAEEAGEVLDELEDAEHAEITGVGDELELRDSRQAIAADAEPGYRGQLMHAGGKSSSVGVAGGFSGDDKRGAGSIGHGRARQSSSAGMPTSWSRYCNW
jgi:hypothetical protein